MPKERKRKNKLLLSIIIVCLLSVLGVGCFAGYQYYKEQKRGNEIRNVGKKMTTDSIKENNDEDPNASEKLMNDIDSGAADPLNFEIDWDTLKATNKDIIAWMRVPGTSLSYPILQEQSVGRYYYQTHNMYRRYDELGAVFTPAVEESEEKNNELLLFAHNSFGWYGDVYFARLAEWYGNATNANKYRYAYVYYPNGDIEKYQVWAGDHATTNSPVYTLPQPKGSDEYKQTLDYTAANAEYTIGDAPDKNTKTMVMSTCEELSSTSPYRFYASFKLVEEYERK